MKFPRKLISLVILACLMWACDTIVKIDLPDEPPRLALNAMIGPDVPWRVRVAASKDVLQVDWNTQFKTPDNTQVTVSGEEGDILLTYEPYCWTEDCNESFEEGQGLFVSEEMRPVPGCTYTITASAPGFETVTATERVPDVVSIQEVLLTAFSQSEGNEGFDDQYFFEASITWDDPTEEDNFYMIEAYVESDFVRLLYDNEGNEIGRDTIMTLERTFLNSNDPIVIEPSSFVGGNTNGRGLVFADGTFNGQRKTLTVFQNQWGKVRRIIFVLRNISESYWRYYLTYDQQYLAEDNPLAQPVQVFSNINNGFGLLAAFTSDSAAVFPN